MQNMPVIFVSHGSPMLAVDTQNGQIFTDWARTLPVPEAILVFSAHWETEGLKLGNTQNHEELVYDFYGFPDQLYQIQYPAPGAATLSEEIESLLGQTDAISRTQRGLDHGVWVPFLHMWPQANIPILQMSIPHNFTNQDLYTLGQRLAPLRSKGILISANGTLTHNLREWNPRGDTQTPEWARAFDDWTKETLLSGNVDALLRWEQTAPYAKQNHPTPEHFRPLLIAVGASAGDKIEFPIEGFEYGIFSKRSIQFTQSSLPNAK